MSQSILITPAHVAGFSSHTRAAVREIALKQICAGRGRVLQDITGFNRPRINPVRIQSAANLPSIGSGKSRTAFEPTNSLVAHAVRLFSLCVGHRRLIINFFRPKATAGKWFLLFRTLVQYPQKSGRSVTHGFGLAPVHVLSLFASCHGNDHDIRRDENARIPIGEVRNVVR